MSDTQNTHSPDAKNQNVSTRQAHLAILARVPTHQLKEAYDALPTKPKYSFDRNPEFGMLMSEGRSGGTGSRFNLGHVSITRTALRLQTGEQGVGYCLGQDEDKAELIAVFDALLQTEVADHVTTKLIEPARNQQQEEREKASRKSASSKVDFFTMSRAENPDKNLRK